MYTFLNGFKPVAQARKMNDNIDSLLRDPFWDQLEQFSTQPSKGWRSIKEDLKIKIVKGELNVISINEENRWVGSFDKIFTVPTEVDTKKIKAKVEHGVLTLTLPIKEDTENFIDIK